jgi:iron complex transport system substrate-binding protein
VARLEALGLTVVALEPRTPDDLRRSLDVIAALLGTPQAGAQAWQRIDAALQQAAARVPAAWRGRAAYVEVGSEPYAAGPGSFVGQMLARLGLANVVPASMGAFPRLNPEFVVRAQPALVLAQTRAAAEMQQRPGWGAIAALRAGAVCSFEPARWDLLVRPGPRLGEGALAVADCLAGLPAPAGAAPAGTAPALGREPGAQAGAARASASELVAPAGAARPSSREPR